MLEDVEAIVHEYGYVSVSGSEVLLESNSSSLHGGRWLTRGMGRVYSPKPPNPPLEGALRSPENVATQAHATVLPEAKTLRAIALPLTEMVDARTVSEHVTRTLDLWTR